MSKVNYHPSSDYLGKTCYVLTKKKGFISNQEIYETMRQNGKYGVYVSVHKISEEYPEDLCEEGDEVALYEPSDLFEGDLLEEKFNAGYEAALSDYRNAIEAFSNNAD